MSDTVSSRDVFICFSKARPGEARVAIDLKDQLEQLGLFAFEYEDWSWVAGDFGDERAVNRGALSHMLTTCSVVVLISPHSGVASVGVQTEMHLLRSLGSPVILLHWSPEGWRPLLNPPELEGLNIVWSLEGTSAKGDVEQNASEHIAGQLAVASWVAYHLRGAASDHAATVGRLLALIPEGPRDPLLNLRLSSTEALASWPNDPNLEELAASVAADAAVDDLRTFVHAWRDGSDLLAERLVDETKFSLRHPVKTLRTAMEALCKHACNRKPEFRDLPYDVLQRRGQTLTRLNRPIEAIAVLQEALTMSPADAHWEIFQQISFAQEAAAKDHLTNAILSMTHAIESAPTADIKCTMTYNRGVIRAGALSTQAEADADFSFVVDHGSRVIRHSALRGRARTRTIDGDYNGAIADYTQIVAEADATPRIAVSAWMDRGALYNKQERLDEAIADWTKAINAADAEPLQNFRSLEARGQALEKLGRRREAADDYEMAARFSSINKAYRAELRSTITRLRR
ncbi:hypothetical protein HB774_34560 (plasmid) [Rhizobium leguminosarum bv. viciae]|nr:hypothetical protein HB774_34560 [Rhizobium leguminosarum bv. viciae]